ncbi:MAG: c-type cytochrome, partial [Pseudomonadota bacterium]
PPIEVSAINISCAACHAAPKYGRDGKPDDQVAVLGRPNTALDLEGFTRHTYRALKAAFADRAAFSAAMARLFPDMGWRERLTLNWLVLPRAAARIAALSDSYDRPLPFPNGAPGLTNGVAALKSRLGLLPVDRYTDGAGFVSIPDIADRGFRSSFLADGAYAIKGEQRFRPINRDEARARTPRRVAELASFFMVPSMGLTPERAATAVPELSQVVSFLGETRALRFPGTVDMARATEGRDIYARDCASCHGTYDDSVATPQLLSFPNWAGSVGTDTSRRDAFDAGLARAVAGTLHGRLYFDAKSTGKTVAPILTGLWSSAPYLTNGSVPTLRHLLKPETRPARFMVGGHLLDFEAVGIAGALGEDGVRRYPVGYKPYSTPVMIDTAKPGLSNRGHTREVEHLTADERTALIEFLKLL